MFSLREPPEQLSSRRSASEGQDHTGNWMSSELDGIPRAVRIAFAIAASCCVVGGCAAVDATRDYGQTAQLIGERTGITEVTLPGGDASQVDAQVNALLADGLTVQEACRIALLNNPRLRGLFLDIGVSRADIVQAGLLTNPSFSLSVQFPEGGGRSKLTGGFAQQIADIWQIPIRQKIAEAQLEQTLLRVADAGLALTAETKAKYYRALVVRESETIVRENLRLVESALEIANERVTEGEATVVDVNLARGNVLEVERELITLKRERAVADAALSEALGLSRSDVQLNLVDTPLSLHPLADEAAIVETAIGRRLDLQLAEYRIREAEAEVRRQELSVFTDVTAGIGFERSSRRATTGRKIWADTARVSIANGELTAPDIQSRSERQRERSQKIDWTVGPEIGITVPIWDQNQAQIAKAGFRLEQSQDEYDAVRNRATREIREALAVARTAQELVTFFSEKAIPQSMTNVETVRDAYKAGEQGILVLIEAQKGLIANQRALLDAERDHAVALSELERVSGGRLEDASNSEKGKDSSSEPRRIEP